MSFVLTHPTPEGYDHSYSILSGRICPNEASPDYMKRFDEIICDFMKEQGVPGAALCISLFGKIIYRQGYGISGPGQLTSSSCHFRIASISKVVTAVAVMRLVEEGRLRLDQKLLGINGILSHIRVSKARQGDIGGITVRDLLRHSGGWDRDEDGDQVFWYQHRPHRAFLDVWNNWSLVMYVLSCPLRFPPGTKHAYSNFGYLLLGLVIEKMTGMKYEEYILAVLRDIGVEDIAVGNTKKQPVDFREVNYYNNKDPPTDRSVFAGEGQVVPQYGGFPMENTAAYGGLVTSAENLVAMIDSLSMAYDHLPKVLKAESVAQMLNKPGYCGDTDQAWYGLGLDVEDDGLSFGHTGAMEGSSTTLHHNKNGLTWCLLMNSWAKDMDLDGLVKFALASIPGLPLWQQMLPGVEQTDNQVMSDDMAQCVRIMLPHAELRSHIKLMQKEGYRIIHLNVLNFGTDIFFTLVWQRNFPKRTEWGVIVDLNLNEFDVQLSKLRMQCMRIVYLEPYWLDGKVRHVCVVERAGKGSQKIYCVGEEAAHKQFVQEYARIGYELRAQSYLYGPKDKVIVTAVYDRVAPIIEPNVQHLWYDLPIEHFVGKLGECVSNRYRIEYMKFCTTPDVPKISAILSRCRSSKDKKVIPCRHKTCELNVFQRHDVSRYGFLFELRESMRVNRRVLFLSAYESEGVVYFATIWKASAPAPPKRIKKKANKPSHIPPPEVVSREERVEVKVEQLEPDDGYFMCMADMGKARPDLGEGMADSEYNRTEAGWEAELETLNIKVERVDTDSDTDEKVVDTSDLKSERDTDSDSDEKVTDTGTVKNEVNTDSDNEEKVGDTGTVKNEVDTDSDNEEKVADTGTVKTEVDTDLDNEEKVTDTGTVKTEVDTDLDYIEKVADTGTVKIEVDTDLDNEEKVADTGESLESLHLPHSSQYHTGTVKSEEDTDLACETADVEADDCVHISTDGHVNAETNPQIVSSTCTYIHESVDNYVKIEGIPQDIQYSDSFHSGAATDQQGIAYSKSTYSSVETDQQGIAYTENVHSNVATLQQGIAYTENVHSNVATLQQGIAYTENVHSDVATLQQGIAYTESLHSDVATLQQGIAYTESLHSDVATLQQGIAYTESLHSDVATLQQGIAYTESLHSDVATLQQGIAYSDTVYHLGDHVMAESELEDKAYYVIVHNSEDGDVKLEIEPQDIHYCGSVSDSVDSQVVVETDHQEVPYSCIARIDSMDSHVVYETNQHGESYSYSGSFPYSIVSQVAIETDQQEVLYGGSVHDSVGAHIKIETEAQDKHVPYTEPCCNSGGDGRGTRVKMETNPQDTLDTAGAKSSRSLQKRRRSRASKGFSRKKKKHSNC